MRSLAQIIKSNEEHTAMKLEALRKQADVTDRIVEMVKQQPDPTLEADAAEVPA